MKDKSPKRVEFKQKILRKLEALKKRIEKAYINREIEKTIREAFED